MPIRGHNQLRRLALASIVLIGLCAAGCSSGGGGGSAPAASSAGNAAPKSGASAQQWATLKVDFTLLSRGVVPVNVDHFRFTGFDSQGSVQFGPVTVTKSSAITLSPVSPVVVSLQIEYLQGTTVVGLGTLPVNLTAGQTLTVTNPPFNTVPAALTSITVTPVSPSIAKGTTQQFTATGTYSDATQRDLTDSVTWSSGDTSKAAVSTSGLATGEGTGQTTITATLGSVTGSADLTVTAAKLVSIQVSPADPSVPAGDTQQFTAIGTFSDNTTQTLTNVTWSTGGAGTATANASGLVTAIAPGQTQVTASLDGVQASTGLRVTNATLTSITVTPASPSIAKGTTQQLTATGIYSDNTQRDLTTSVTWGSVNPTQAIVSNASGSQGLVTGEGQGTTSITATLGNVSGSAGLTVTPATLVSIQVTPATPSIPKGTTQQFTATGTFTDHTTQTLTNVAWSSSAAGVATVSTDGLATANGTGPAQITASLDGVQASVTLTATDAVLTGITVTPVSPSIAKGTTQQFAATGTYSDKTQRDLTDSVTWSSGGTSIATVSNASGSHGLVTGAGAGQTTVTATLGAASGSADLTVTSAVLISIQVSPADPSIPKGTTQQFTAIGTFSNNTTQTLTNVTWSTAQPWDPATVNASGLATAVDTGQTVVIASLDGVQGNTTMTATAAVVTSISVTPASLSTARGTAQQFTATATFSDNTQKDVTDSVTWSSGNGSVAILSDVPGTQGTATATGPGTTSVTATMGSVSSSASLTVTPATLVAITVTPTDPSAPKGTSQQLTAVGTFSDNTTQTLTNAAWTTSAAAVATVNTSGLATANGTGQAKITASLDGVQGSASLDVPAATLVSITVTPTSPSIATGTTQSFAATGNYSDGSQRNLTSSVSWSSGDGSIATVSNASGSPGVTTATGPGHTTVTATLGAVSGSANLTVTSAVLTAIKVTPSDLGVPTGAVQGFIATGVFSDDTTQRLTNATWTTSNAAVATVDAAGQVTAVSPGQANITASLGGVQGSATFAVTGATLVSITVTPASPSIGKGTGQRFSAIGAYTDGSTREVTNSVTWSSGNGSIVTVSNVYGSQGLAIGAGVGTTTVTATLGSVSGSAKLTVTPATVVSIQVTPASATASVNTPNPGPQQFNATCTLSDGTSQTLSNAVWTSSDPKVATLDTSYASYGLVRAYASYPGTTQITASLDGVQGSATLSVTGVILTKVAVTPSNASIAAGTTQQFTATGTWSDGTKDDLTSSATWTTSAASVATFSGADGTNGLATGAGAGKATITATVNGVSGSADLSVTPARLVSMQVTPANPTLPQGAVEQVTAIGTFSDSTRQILSNATWSSSNPAAAIVESSGKVTAVGPGTAQLIATLDGLHASATVTVTAAVTPSDVTGLTILPGDALSAPGTKRRYRAIATLSDGSKQDVTNQVSWSTSDASVATIANDYQSQDVKGQATVVGAAGQTVQIRASLANSSAGTASTTLHVGLFAYATVDGAGPNSESEVAEFVVDPVTGALTPAATFKTASEFPGDQLVSTAVGPSGKFAYVLNMAASGKQGDNVTAFSIDPTSGKLTQTGPAVSVGSYDSAVSLTVDPSGHFLYVAENNDVAAFTIDSTTGSLTPTNPTMFSTGQTNGAVVVDPRGRFLYTANVSVQSVSGFAIDHSTGNLTPTVPQAFGVNAGPVSGEVVDPRGNFIYVAGGSLPYNSSAPGTLEAFFIDPSTGDLFPTYPSNVVVDTDAPASVVIDPSGRFLYVPGTSAVSEFTINPTTGALTPTSPATVANGGYVSLLAIDPSGRLLLVGNGPDVGTTDGTLSSFTINPTTGVPSPADTVPVAAGQMHAIVTTP